MTISKEDAFKDHENVKELERQERLKIAREARAKKRKAREFYQMKKAEENFSVKIFSKKDEKKLKELGLISSKNKKKKRANQAQA